MPTKGWITSAARRITIVRSLPYLSGLRWRIALLQGILEKGGCIGLDHCVNNVEDESVRCIKCAGCGGITEENDGVRGFRHCSIYGMRCVDVPGVGGSITVDVCYTPLL